MKALIKNIKNSIKKVLNLIPTLLPQGVDAHRIWASDIIETYGAPDNESVRFALAVMIMHLDSTTDRKAKHYFGKALHKAAANEIAHAVAQDFKQKQQAAMAQKPVEATTLKVVSDSGPQQTGA